MASRRKLWFGIGAFVLTGGETQALPPHEPAMQPLDQPAAEKTRAALDTHSRSALRTAQAFAAAAGGEAGEGGEGGEAGINVEAAATDPVEYGIALQVIAAHYHAGLAAYEAGEREAGAQMFAHGLSEVYVEMQDVFARRGVAALGKTLEAAVEAASAAKPPREVRRRVQQVYAALKAAEKAAPESAMSAQAVRAHVTAEMIERAAAQFAAAQKDSGLEAYLDGLGFAVAAKEQAAQVLPWLRKIDRRKAEALSKALALTAKAYPGIKRPASPKVGLPDLLAAASGARLAVSGLK